MVRRIRQARRRFHLPNSSIHTQNRHIAFLNSRIHTSKSALSIPQQPKSCLQTAALNAEYTVCIPYDFDLQNGFAR